MKYFILNNVDATAERYTISLETASTVRANIAGTQVILKTSQTNATDPGQPFNGCPELTADEARTEMDKAAWSTPLT